MPDKQTTVTKSGVADHEIDEDGKFIMTEMGFCNHMDTKARSTEAETLYVGVDFAVFCFRFPYQASRTLAQFQNTNKYYGYSISVFDTQLLVINTPFINRQKK